MESIYDLRKNKNYKTYLQIIPVIVFVAFNHPINTINSSNISNIIKKIDITLSSLIPIGSRKNDIISKHYKIFFILNELVKDDNNKIFRAFVSRKTLSNEIIKKYEKYGSKEVIKLHGMITPITDELNPQVKPEIVKTVGDYKNNSWIFQFFPDGYTERYKFLCNLSIFNKILTNSQLIIVKDKDKSKIPTNNSFNYYVYNEITNLVDVANLANQAICETFLLDKIKGLLLKKYLRENIFLVDYKLYAEDIEILNKLIYNICVLENVNPFINKKHFLCFDMFYSKKIFENKQITDNQSIYDGQAGYNRNADDRQNDKEPSINRNIRKNILFFRRPKCKKILRSKWMVYKIYNNQPKRKGKTLKSYNKYNQRKYKYIN